MSMERGSQLADRLNVVPIGVMSAGWIAPMLLFWGRVWGPLRPHDVEAVTIPGDYVFGGFLLSFLPILLPASYYELRAIEKDGRLYERLGVRRFRSVVTNGDWIARIVRRKEPAYRFLATRSALLAYRRRTVAIERAHLVLMLMGALSAVAAWRVGWLGWALFLLGGNVVVNLYPALLQRYTRARIDRGRCGTRRLNGKGAAESARRPETASL